METTCNKLYLTNLFCVQFFSLNIKGFFSQKDIEYYYFWDVQDVVNHCPSLSTTDFPLFFILFFLENDIP